MSVKSAFAGALSEGDLATLARNSFLGAFLPDSEIARHLAAVDAYAEQRGGRSLAGGAGPD